MEILKIKKIGRFVSLDAEQNHHIEKQFLSPNNAFVKEKYPLKQKLFTKKIMTSKIFGMPQASCF